MFSTVFKNFHSIGIKHSQKTGSRSYSTLDHSIKGNWLDSENSLCISVCNYVHLIYCILVEIHHDGCNKKFLLNKYHLPNTHLFHVHHCKRLSMFLSKSEQILNPISQGNQGRSCFRQHVAKSYFETYKSYDHMQSFRPLSQKFSEISRFEKFEFLRFCLTLTHRNCHNSLNF